MSERATREPSTDVAATGASLGGRVVELDGRRILRALRQRGRYRYVQPRVERCEEGWQVYSPNCSRNVDPSGGEIPIAWFEPEEGGRWRLHSRDHRAGLWQLQAEGLTLQDALTLVCADVHRRFWQ